MSGKGKYTTYAPAANAKNTLLKKLFGLNTPPAQLPPQMTFDPGKEADVLAAVLANATAPVVQGVGGLDPSTGIQAGDLGMFPKGVDMSFAGSLLDPPNSPPDLTQVKWVNPGDPANSYIPDITSPGAGKTEGKDKMVDPGIKGVDIKPAYLPGQPNSSTRNPTDTGTTLVKADVLGTNPPKGDSGANT